MTFQALLAKIEALLGNAESHAKAIVERDNKITALTEANAAARRDIDALTAQLAALKTEKDAADAKAQASESERVKAEESAALLKAESEKLKASPSLQAQAILANVGHSGVAAGNGASAGTPENQIDPKLTGLQRAIAARKRQSQVTS